MSKVITSPIERFPGTVTLSDPLLLPQVAAVEAGHMQMLDFKRRTKRMYYAAMLPGLYKCVERWDLKVVDAEGQEGPWKAFAWELFPLKPEGEAAALATWLETEINKLWEEATREVPKASAPTPTPKPSDSKPETESNGGSSTAES